MSFEDVLDVWFGELDKDGLASAAMQTRWWRRDAVFDADLRARFGELHAEVAAGAHTDWRETPRGMLATVIVLDQLSRNLFRDTPGMYAHDARATALAEEAHARGDAAALRFHERLFLAMPFMHSESLADQERCVALLRELGEVHSSLAGNVGFAIQHRDIVARFGRFPHRNAVLGRASTAEEEAFLKEPGSSF